MKRLKITFLSARRDTPILRRHAFFDSYDAENMYSDTGFQCMYKYGKYLYVPDSNFVFKYVKYTGDISFWLDGYEKANINTFSRFKLNYYLFKTKLNQMYEPLRT